MTSADSLFDQLLALEADRKRPPVQDWHPSRTGTIDIRIARDGTWYHEGTRFQRDALIRLFASILRRDADGFYLVTPAERLRIEVEDAPLVAVDLEVRGSGTEQELLFVSNVGDIVIADSEHPIRVADPDVSPRPYVGVRDGIEALIARPVWYRLMELAGIGDHGAVLYSRGCRFDLGRS